MIRRSLALLCLSALSGSAYAEGANFDSAVISGLGARNIGSATMSGRIAAVAARVEKDGRTTIFIGSASGGVWKSLDGGTTFKPVFDKEKVQSIGAVALDPTNHETVWAGTGESWTRNSVSLGDGIYKSTDGGESWTRMGLENSERISRIIVDPTDGKTVYACVPGRLWSDSADRGLYKTSDGGKSWSLILKGANLSTGCSALSLDPKDPKHLIAALWDFRRKGWTFRSGGEGPDQPSGSGLYVTHDGGKSFEHLTPQNSKGLPAEPYGRIAVAIAPSDSKIVYAFIEGTRSALFRSNDGGKTWEERDRSQSMVWRPFYFANLIVDPKNPDRLFKPNFSLVESEDGGKSFAVVSQGTHGDHHDVWIDPTDTKHVITVDDGGLWISQDGGAKWAKADNLPIGQFYHVSLDDRDPYQVYGGLQDNSSWVGDSAYPGGITNSRWENLYGGDGFWAFPDPTDENFVYAEYQGGEISRINRKTLASRHIQPLANYGEKLRYNWNTPIQLSPTDKSTVYIGAQFLFKSIDHGETWARISPDLSTNDPERQKQELSGGITVDNSAAETHTTVYSISESPKNHDLVWVGTDDGNIQLTRDGGKNWTKVGETLPGVGSDRWISWVEASRFDEGTAFAAVDRHAYGDIDPHVFKTTDYGKTWTRIADASSGVRGYAHVIRQDLEVPGLLFLGTEFGLFVSIDGGGHWAEFKGGNFPSVAVRDIAIHPRDKDLVLATHGRGIWIIDDITPWRRLDASTLDKNVAFLPGRSNQLRIGANGGWSEGDATFTGPNPVGPAVITYYQKSRHLFGKLKIEVLDKDGKVLDTLAPQVRRGINRVTWNARLTAPRVPPAVQLAFSATRGPRVLPGVYTVRLTKGSEVVTTTFEITLDRRAEFSVKDREAQLAAMLRVRDLFSEMSDMAMQINAIRAGAAKAAAPLKAGDDLKAKLSSLSAKADQLRGKIVATKEGGAITGEERLREHMDKLYGVLSSYEGAPTATALARIDALAHEQGDVGKDLKALMAKDLAEVNAALTARNQAPIAVPPPSSEKGPGGGSEEIRKGLEGFVFSLRPAPTAAEEVREERD